MKRKFQLVSWSLSFICCQPKFHDMEISTSVSVSWVCVCLCVFICSLSTTHSSTAVFTKLHWEVGFCPGKNWLNFGRYLHLDPDIGLLYGFFDIAISGSFTLFIVLTSCSFSIDCSRSCLCHVLPDNEEVIDFADIPASPSSLINLVCLSVCYSHMQNYWLDVHENFVRDVCIWTRKNWSNVQ